MIIKFAYAVIVLFSFHTISCSELSSDTTECLATQKPIDLEKLMALLPDFSTKTVFPPLENCQIDGETIVREFLAIADDPSISTEEFNTINHKLRSVFTHHADPNVLPKDLIMQLYAHKSPPPKDQFILYMPKYTWHHHTLAFLISKGLKFEHPSQIIKQLIQDFNCEGAIELLPGIISLYITQHGTEGLYDFVHGSYAPGHQPIKLIFPYLAFHFRNIPPKISKCVEILLRCNADPNTVNCHTLLHQIICAEDQHLLKVLLTLKADPNMTSNDWPTPLSAAVKSGNCQSVALLLEAKAAPLQLAHMINNPEILALVQAAEHQQDRFPSTALSNLPNNFISESDEIG